MDWNEHFLILFKNAVERFHSNARPTIDNTINAEDNKFLLSIGCRAAEFFPYVQSYAKTGEPSPSSLLLISHVRRSFFINSQRGIHCKAKPITNDDLPKASDEYQGINYMPRLIDKAQGKLYGTLDPSIMYGCTQDRAFLATLMGMHPADFLTLIWDARGDKHKVINAILSMKRRQEESQQKSN